VDFNISIIVPVYNVESYLSDCLKSLQNQTYSNFEVIVVDDGSKDNSGIIAKEFCNKDKRFKYIKQENKGLGGARNTGLLNAKGEYIFFLDSDDKLTVNAVELMKNKIKNNNYDIILGRPVWCKNGEYLGTYIDHIFKDEDYLISSIQLKDVVIVTSQLIKKDLFFKNNIFFEEKVTSEDVEISLKLQNCSQKILCTNEIFYLRTEREDEENLSITQRFDCKIVKDRLNSSKRIIEIKVKDLYKENKKSRIIQNINYIRNGLIKENDLKKCQLIIEEMKKFLKNNKNNELFNKYFDAVFLLNFKSLCSLDDKEILQKIKNDNLINKIKRKVKISKL